MSDLIEVDGQLFTDEELTAQALAADPDAHIDDGAVPFAALRGQFGDLLPEWYMPAPGIGHTALCRGRRRNAVVASVVIASLLVINALGLCITYGRLEIPF